jgi:hypothetical protein
MKTVSSNALIRTIASNRKLYLIFDARDEKMSALGAQ